MNNNSLELRKLLIDLDTKKILMSKFNNSVQKSDIRLPINCNGFGRIHHFEFLKNKNWMSDPLPQLAVKRQFNRDIDVESTMNVEMFQIAACNFNCW